MQPAFIHGAAISIGWADATVSLSDMIFKAVSRALDDSGIQIEQIESVVLSAHDIIDGRSLSSMVTAPAAGAYLRDEIRLAEDGAAALSLASARIEAGETDYSIVAAWGRASEGDYAHTSKFAFDPFFEQPFALEEFDLSALRLSGWMAAHGEQGSARAAANAARIARARANPRSTAVDARPRLKPPLLPQEAPRFADVAIAAILGRAESPVRIAGTGHSVESAVLGDRDLVRMRALREAVERAGGLGRIDVYQLGGATLPDEAIALEALGLAAPGEGFAAYAARPEINPSGGAESGWCFPTSGLLNVVEAYLQLTGAAGGAQLPGKLGRALATGLSPLGGQAAHAVILEAA
jgi:acetyl-CoA C-acetyltransferase